MSGGVDSSMAAALLARSGNVVIGVTMRLWGEDRDSDPAISSAREVCGLLGIEHKVLDVRESFRNLIIDYFLDEYTSGLTPNPCVRCNEEIKFGILLKFMDLVRAERLATGHYARVLLDGKTGRYALMKAIDERKDQSYFMYRLGQKQLGLSVFPLGGLTKEEVRQKARELSLPNAERTESQEVCFIPDNDYRGFIESERPDSVREGRFIDKDGKVLGSHRGVAFYTVGQRRGIGVSSPLGRRYVISRDPAANDITLGEEEELKRPGCSVGSVNWVAAESLGAPRLAEVRLRYRSAPVKAMLEPDGEDVTVRFIKPEAGVSPGQSAVFYDGDTVIGGGIIIR